MIKDLARLVQLGIITLDSIKDPSIRQQVEYELNK
jgi:hypothetical protein